MLVLLLTLVGVCVSVEHPFGLVGERSSLPKSKLHTKHHNKGFFSLQSHWRSWRIIVKHSQCPGSVIHGQGVALVFLQLSLQVTLTSSSILYHYNLNI